MITKMHISRGEARTPTPTATSPARTRRKRTSRGARVACLLAFFACDLGLSLSGCPCCRRDGGSATGRLSTAHARASSVPGHAKGTVFLPLGAQSGSSVRSQIANIPHHPQQQQPASAQHISSHAHIVSSLCCANHRLPLLAYFPRLSLLP